jgi:4-amino-4-deoxy-L-arabinose transferase-like glycosyltransferase
VTAKKESFLLVALLSIFIALLFVDLPGSWLFNPDEARYAEISREMIVRRDFVTPHLNGAHYFEKPPLLYWMNAASLSVLGETPFAARLATRLAMLGTLGILIVGMSSAGSVSAGLWAALILVSSPLPFALGRTNIIDCLLTFFLTTTFFFMREYLCRKDDGRPTRWQEIGIGVGSGLAFMSKGLVGFLFPAMVLVLWSLWTRKWKRVPELFFSAATPVALLIIAPWLVLMESANPGFLKFFFIHEHFQRFATNEADRSGPIYYFVAGFAGGFLPLILFLVGPIVGFLKDKKRMLSAEWNFIFFVIWAVSIMAFFSVSKSKLLPYILPCFPPVAALMGKWIVESSHEFKRAWNWHAIMFSLLSVMLMFVAQRSGFVARYGLEHHALVVASLMLIGALGGWVLSRQNVKSGFLFQMACWAGVYTVLVLALPRIMIDYSEHDLVPIIVASKPDQIVTYKSYSQTLPFEALLFPQIFLIAKGFPTRFVRSSSRFPNREKGRCWNPTTL